MSSSSSSILYLACAVAFVIGLHLMNSPRTARRGNALSAVGMAVAVVVALVNAVSNGFGHAAAPIVLLACIGVGSAVGAVKGRRVEMTAMPQLVSAFNMVGGAAAGLIALLEAVRATSSNPISTSVSSALGILVGSFTVTGSLIAAGKLQGFVSGNPITFPAHRVMESAGIGLAVIGAVWLVITPDRTGPLLVLLAASLAVGCDGATGRRTSAPRRSGS